MPEPLKKRVAHRISLDYRTGSLWIEGVEVPFHISPEVEVHDFDGAVGGVTVTLYADEVEVISKAGTSKIRRSRAADQTDMEFARREARRIVHEGMADVLEWLWTGSTRQLEEWPVRYALGFDPDELHALTSQTTHSESGQEEGDRK